MKRNQTNDSALCEELPYWEFLSEPFAHLILNDGSITSGLQISLKDIECLDDHEINQFTVSLRGVLNSISENVSAQFFLSVRSDFSQMIKNHCELKESDVHPLVEEMVNFRKTKLSDALKKGELYRPKLFLFLRASLGTKSKLNFLKKGEDFSLEANKQYEETLDILHQNIENLVSSFQAVGLNCKELIRSEIINCVYTFLNPMRSKEEPAPMVYSPIENNVEEQVIKENGWLAGQSPREQIVFGDLILEFNQFILDSHYFRVITLKTLPEITFAGQLSNFLRMPFHYDLMLSIDVPPQTMEMTKLQQKRKMAHSLAVTSGGKVSDIESESKLSSTEELIRELINTGQRIYTIQMSIILKASVTTAGNKILNKQVRDVLSRFRLLQGAEGMEESVGAWKIVKGNLPAAPRIFSRARKMKTNNLADFLPVYGAREGDLDPVVIFRNRLNGLVGYNSFDPSLPNFNTLVTGSSGAGKSFLNNCILLQELARNLRVFIVDIGGSYKKLTEALGGQYLEINLTDQYRINPFDIPDVSKRPSNQKLKSLLAIIESMVSDDETRRLPKLDQVLLEKTIIELYKKGKDKIPVLSDLAKELSKLEEPSMKAIAEMLYSWTGERPYGQLLDGEGKLDSNALICTFDLKGLSYYPDLQSVMILILTDFILNQVEQDKTHKKRIILDEAWELLKSPAAASFMEYCARTLRKTGSGITFITQGIEEIVASPIGSAIINNTATKFIMLQRGDSKILVDTLKLNTQELGLIHSLEQKKGEYSEGFLIEGEHRQVIRIIPGPFEYWLSTSDSEDNNYLSKLISQGKTLAEAVTLASKTFPSGVAHA